MAGKNIHEILYVEERQREKKITTFVHGGAYLGCTDVNYALHLQFNAWIIISISNLYGSLDNRRVKETSRVRQSLNYTPFSQR